MRKKILVDIYLAFNLGDDMFLDHLAKRFPNVDWVPFHPGNNYNLFFKTYSNVQKFPYGFIDKIKARTGYDKLKDYGSMGKEYDGLLFLGGGIFREESYWKEVFKYRGSIISEFKKNKKPVWFMSCSFGPFNSDVFVNSYRSLFEKVNSVSFRDKNSFHLFKNIESATYAPDLLWSYQLPATEKMEKLLGISVIDPMHKEGFEETASKYIKAHRDLISKYIQEGFKVRIFSFCEREGDTRIAKEIIGSNIDCDLIEYSGNIESFLKEIGSCSHFVASRFHANIISLKYRQSLLPVIYGDKTENLLTDLKIDHPIIRLENIQDLPNADFIKIPDESILNLETESLKHFEIGL